MKIIAKSGTDKVLVEMTHREVANIAGKDYESELVTRERHCPDRNGMEIGTEYAVNLIFNRLRSQQEVAPQLNQAAASLEALAALIRTVIPTAELVTKDEVLK